MDVENTTKMGLERLRKRQREKKVDEDAHIDNNQEPNDITQERISVRETRSGTKRKLIMSETSDLGKQLKESSNKIDLVTNIHDKNVPKEDENIESDNKPSKRQLKKEKAFQMVTRNRQTKKLNNMQKALNYVSIWKHSRSEWRFEKLKQIWLMDNLLDHSLIPEAIFPTVLEYFEGCKGMAREVLLKKGLKVIRKAEEEENESKRIIIMESHAYKRARQLLQALPSDR